VEREGDFYLPLDPLSRWIVPRVLYISIVPKSLCKPRSPDGVWWVPSVWKHGDPEWNKLGDEAAQIST
jgi:hypothetical protein